MATLSAIWQLILLALKYGPIIEAGVEDGVDWVVFRVRLKKLDQAIEKSHDTKDTSGLEGLLNPKSDDSSARGDH